MIKTAVAPAVCAAVILYGSWMVHRSRQSAVSLADTARVEITVRGPDGKIIPPLRRVR